MELITPVVDILEIMEQTIYENHRTVMDEIRAMKSRVANVEEHSRCHELLCRLDRQDEENKRLLGIHE